MGNSVDTAFLCARLKELREVTNKCTMEKMAQKLAVIDNGAVPHRSSISRVEAGKTSEKTLIDMAKKYCKVFGMSDSQTEDFLRGRKIAIPDTSALLRNAQLIDELNKKYYKVIIPKVVVDELDKIKNHSTNTTLKKKAWEIIKGIGYGTKTLLVEYKGSHEENNDCKIISIAREASNEYLSKVDIITEDTDYSAYLKGDENVTALHLKDYMKQQEEILLNMDRMDKFNSMYLDSYEGVERPTVEEANGYLKDGNTMIISAVRNKSASFEHRKTKILWLINCGADVNKQDHSRRYFPAITHAVQKNDYEMLKFLLNECNANPNVGSRNPHDAGYLRQKNEGNMALMVASRHGRELMVKLLCENARISINQQDSNGYTALMKACMNGNTRCRDILLEYGADERIVDINGMTAMDHYNKFLEKGPSEKKYDRSNAYRKHNNGRNRW